MKSLQLHTVLILCLLIGVTLTSFGQFKVACTCIDIPSPRDAYLASSSVFSGRVQSMTVDTIQGFFNLKVTLQVSHTWKGSSSSLVSVYTAISTASCGADFHLDSTYLVYAYRYYDTLATNLCTRTRTLSSAAADLAYLTTVDVRPYLMSSANPATLQLSQNYPNPANPSTIFRFSLPQSTRAILTLHSLSGSQVRVLLDETRSAGTHEITANLSGLSSGVYFCRLRTNSGSTSCRFTVLK